MADNIGTAGGESLTIVNMKPSGGGVEEINALWGQKMAANDGAYAGNNLGHLHYAQGTIITAQGSYGTAFLTQNAANGGVALFSQYPGITIYDQMGAGTHRVTIDWVQIGIDYAFETSLVHGTMLLIRREDNEAVGTYIWTAIGI